MIAVLDTSAILSGKFYFGGADRVMTTSSVVREFSKGGHSWRLIQYTMGAGMEVIAPNSDSVGKVRAAAEHTGDLEELSEADIGVMALALGFKDAVLFTDDYSMQNVALHLGISYEGILQRGIKEKFQWKYRCSSCGKSVDAGIRACPVCGGKIKRVRWK